MGWDQTVQSLKGAVQLIRLEEEQTLLCTQLAMSKALKFPNLCAFVPDEINPTDLCSIWILAGKKNIRLCVVPLVSVGLLFPSLLELNVLKTFSWQFSANVLRCAVDVPACSGGS